MSRFVKKINEFIDNENLKMLMFHFGSVVGFGYFISDEIESRNDQKWSKKIFRTYGDLKTLDKKYGYSFEDFDEEKIIRRIDYFQEYFNNEAKSYLDTYFILKGFTYSLYYGLCYRFCGLTIPIIILRKFVE